MAARNDEAQFEVDRDIGTRLVAEQYRSTGYGLHFHRNVEIYGVVSGEVCVTIAGERHLLTDGQMAVANCMEVHEYVIKDDAEIFYLHLGSAYLSVFGSLYKHSLLPHWLLDSEYNKELYEQIKYVINYQGQISELKKHGICNNLLADIVSHYGVITGGYDNKSHELIEQVIQYIYEHYAEDITLASLASVFCTDPKTLSKKLSRCIGVDLRMFINDIRMQKAIQMWEDPDMRSRPKKEIARLCGFTNERTFYNVLKRNKEFYNKTEDK